MHGTSTQVVLGYVDVKQPFFGSEVFDIAFRQCGGAADLLGDECAWNAGVLRACAPTAFEKKSVPANAEMTLAARSKACCSDAMDLGDACLIVVPSKGAKSGTSKCGEYP